MSTSKTWHWHSVGICAISLACRLTAAPGQGLWDNRFTIPGVIGSVAVIQEWNGGVIVGGMFESAGPITAANVARWDGTNWYSLATGLNGGLMAHVCALDKIGPHLYAGGHFTHAGDLTVNNVARWDGATWSPLGAGLNGFASALCVIGSDLYVGGQFDTAGGEKANRIARWDGTRWSALGSGVSHIVASENGPYEDSQVIAMATDGTNLYVGGRIGSAGGVQATNIAKWDGTNWTALGTRFVGAVTALTLKSGVLYAGGPRVARWNGGDWDWDAFGATELGGVQAIFVGDSGEIFVGGQSLRTWNGTAWASVGNGLWQDAFVGGGVSALKEIGGELWVGGDFSSAGNIAARGIARWNGSAYRGVGPDGLGLGGPVFSLAVLDGNICAGGSFRSAGAQSITNLAQWDGTNWSSLNWSGGPINGGALFNYGGKLHLKQNNAGSLTFLRLEGNSWRPWTISAQGQIHAAVSHKGDLYVGGAFTSVDGIPATNIARWNGASWSALGVPPWESLFFFGWKSIAFHGEEIFALYYSIKPTPMGDIALSQFARWDGLSWSSGAGSLDPELMGGMITVGEHLYVGYGHEQTPLMRRNGTNWLPVDRGPLRRVDTMATDGLSLYVAGILDLQGTRSLGIAEWDGLQWEIITSRIKGYGGYATAISDMVFSGRQLYVAGPFDVLGETPSQSFGILQLPYQLRIRSVADGLRLSWPATGTNFSLETTIQLPGANWTDGLPPPTLVDDQLVVTNQLDGGSRFYRLRRR